MIDLNSVILSGRVVADSVSKMSNLGTEFTGFAIAVNDDYKNKQTQEWIKRAYFFDCVLLKPKILKKGEPVIVYGKLATKTQEYNGEKRTYIKILADRVIRCVAENKKTNIQQQDDITVEDDDTPPF